MTAMTDPVKIKRGHAQFWVVLALITGLIAANHTEFALRSRRTAAAAGDGVQVRIEDDGISGHRTIGIAESSGSPSGTRFLSYSLLGRWAYDPQTHGACPPEIQAEDGRPATCIGFMYPLEPGAALKTFCLLRTTQTCCYGPRPNWNQYLLVEMSAPVRFERLKPVTVTGVFHVDPRPEEGYIYRLEGRIMTPAADTMPEMDPAEAARKAGLPLLDIGLLADRQAGSAGLPDGLKILEGRRVVVAGYLFDRTGGVRPSITVGREYWDGVSKGVPPGIHNAVLVGLADAGQMPLAWQDHGIFTGTAAVEADPGRWQAHGIIRLTGAVYGVPGVLEPGIRTTGGPILATWLEIILAAAGLALAWRADGRTNLKG